MHMLMRKESQLYDYFMLLTKFKAQYGLKMSISKAETLTYQNFRTWRHFIRDIENESSNAAANRFQNKFII